MPPRVQLSDDEAARLPGLLRHVPDSPHKFADCTSALERVRWVIAAYANADTDAKGRPLTPNLIALLVFEQGVNLSVATVERALSESAAD